jgi:hypothetical protein
MKTYSIKKTRKDKERIFTGTLEDLIKSFSYTLECGHSWNHKIPTNPKSIKSLIKALNDSVYETQGGCFTQDYYEQTENKVV